MSRLERDTLIACGMVLVVAIYALYKLPDIHAWEKAHGYPYGMLCDVYRSCR